MTELPALPLDPERPASAVLRDARPPSPRDRESDREDDREAIELREIQTQEDHELDYSLASASSGEEYRVARRTTSRRSVRRPRVQRKGGWQKICRFWTHNVTLTVPQKSNRDHLGELRGAPNGTFDTGSLC
jgi:hypothetical protein